VAQAAVPALGVEPAAEQDQGARGQPATLIGATPWLVLLVLGALLSSTVTVASGDAVLGLAVAILLLFVVLPLRAPLETAFLLIATSWIPLEQLLGEERSLFAFAAGVNISGVRLVGGFAGLVIALFVSRQRLRRVAIPRWLGIGLVVYGIAVAWMALSAAWGPSTVDGLRAVAKLVFPLFVGAVVLSDPRGWGAQKLTRQTLLLLAATLTVAAIYGSAGLFARDALLTTDDPFAGDYFGWAGWSLYSFLAGVVGLTFFALAEHQQLRWAWLFALAALSQVGLTAVRIGIAAAALAVFVMTAVAGVRRVLAPLAIAACAVILLAFPPVAQRGFFEDRGPGGNIAQLIERPLDVVNTQGRDRLWSQALGSMTGTEFIRGRGLNAFFTETGRVPELSPRFAASNFEAGEIEVAGRSTLRQMHGEYVRFLYETGAIGLGLFVAAWVLILAALVRMAIRVPKHTLRRALAEAALGVTVFYLATGITDNTFDYYLVGGIAWTIVALAVAVRQAGAADGGEGATPGRLDDDRPRPGADSLPHTGVRRARTSRVGVASLSPRREPPDG
jgi:hypothetical protein